MKPDIYWICPKCGAGNIAMVEDDGFAECFECGCELSWDDVLVGPEP